jgi:DNA-binding IclR family transcriptional regulator
MSDGDGLNSVMGKVSAILDAVSAYTELTLTAIADQTGLPKSTVYRLAKRMVLWGALDNTERGYCIGVRTFELARAASGVQQLREAAMPYLLDLYEMTHEVVHLGILSHSDVLYVEKIAGRHSVNVPTTVGGRMPTYCTGLGKAMLAYSDPAYTELALRSKLAARTQYTIVSPKLFYDNLRKVRATKVAVERQEALMGVGCVASPLLSTDGTAVGAVSVTVPAERLKVGLHGHAVHAAAQKLSTALAREGVRLSSSLDSEFPWSPRLRTSAERSA